ncbi:MAG: SurA N-terminal domain-containing protein [Porphyromonas sp.]|nr:SurA N-terminal domain-containing protein [Porphyromonas sp.]
MATLEKIRSKYAVLLVVLLGLAMLAFVLGDLFRGGSTLFQDSQMVVLSVNGENVKIQDFEKRVEETTQNYKMFSGNRELAEADYQQIRNQVYSTIIMESVLNGEAEKIGLTISPEEVYDLVQGENISPLILQSPMFKNEQGNFDREGFIEFRKSIGEKQINEASPEVRQQLLQYRAYWLSIENQVKAFRMNEKYDALLTKGIVANKLDIATAATEEKEMATIAYVAQNTFAMPDSLVTVSDSEMKEYYNTHKEMFKVPAYRVVDVIYSTLVPSEKDKEDTKKDVEDAAAEMAQGDNYNDIISSYSDMKYIDSYLSEELLRSEYFYTGMMDQIKSVEVGTVLPMHQSGNTYAVAKLVGKKVAPDSIFIRHILQPATAEGTKTIDSLLTVLGSTPTAFAELAAQFSQDPGSKDNAGELGWVTEIQALQSFGEEFRDALFSAQMNKPFKFTSRFGEHILLVDKATAPVNKYKVAYMAKGVEPGTETYTKAYNDISSFKAAYNKAEGIDTAAINKGYQVLYNMEVYPSSSAISQNIQGSRELVRWAFNNPKGSVSDIKDYEDKFVMAVVRKEIPQGYKPFEESKEEIRPVLSNEKKVEKLFAQLKSQNPQSLEEFAVANSLPTDTLRHLGFASNRIDGVGFEPVLNAVAASAPLNTVLPVKGMNGVYVVKVAERVPNTNSALTSANAGDLIQANLQAKVRMQAIRLLMSKVDVVDNRVRFY